jgi:hypothetical protein
MTVDSHPTARSTSLRSTPLSRWVLLFAAAEAVGMTAAAAAARISTTVVGEARTIGEALFSVVLVTAGGVVEGLAVGAATYTALSPMAPTLRRRAWMTVTVLVAGLGWAVGSVPSVMAAGGDDAAPPLAVIAAGALALGALMGAALGAAQSVVLLGHIARPWRWTAVSAAAWAPTMAVIFVGASTPDASWAAVPVLAFGALTGACAGAALGLLLGWWSPALLDRRGAVPGGQPAAAGREDRRR